MAAVGGTQSWERDLMRKAPSVTKKDPILSAPLKRGEMIVGGVRYYWEPSSRKVMAQGPDSEPYVPDPADIPKDLGDSLMAGR